MTPEITLAAVGIVAPAVGWLVVRTARHEEAIDTIKTTLQRLEEGQERLIEHLINRPNDRQDR